MTHENEATGLGQSALKPPTRDLGSTFNPSLRGKLPRPTPAPATTPSVDPPETGDSSTPAEPAQAEQKKDARPASRATDTVVTKGRVIYLPDHVRDALSTACAAQHKTRTVMILQAVEATYQQLGELVAEDRKPRLIKGALWDSVQTPSRADQPAKRQVFIKLTAQQQAVIDQLVIDADARDRSHLIAVALSAHLQIQ